MIKQTAATQDRFARQMRATPTQAERKLWWHLRYCLSIKGTHFRRQVRIDRYIVDFACHAKRIVVEVDGSQHGSQIAADDERTKVLQANGYRVLRYWNNDIFKNIDNVLEEIQGVITNAPTPNPSPQPPHAARGVGTPAGGGEQNCACGNGDRASR
jgi:very-short-patch-repair endonuclease